MKSIRLDKYLADLQIGTRSQVKQFLKKGLVTVNGETVRKPEIKIDPSVDRVYFDNQPLSYQKDVYYMLHKPGGVVSATKDNLDKTVIDLIAPEDRRDDLSMVGRLDKDTTGLLLLTTDGALSHHLLSPRHHVDKTYLVQTDAPVTKTMVDAFAKGLDIGDEKETLPARLVYDNGVPDNHWSQVTIHEGRFHQIKRMFHAVGTEVTALKRLSMGTLVLDESLAPGEYRPLTEEEIAKLKG